MNGHGRRLSSHSRYVEFPPARSHTALQRPCVLTFTSLILRASQLETDDDILRQKSEQAISKYGVDAVVANILHTRYAVVQIVRRERSGGEADGQFVSEDIRRSDDGKPIEAAIMSKLQNLHNEHISKSV